MKIRNLKVLITAGPTREHLDPIRFLTNSSSGKMGYALALAAKRKGAKVSYNDPYVKELSLDGGNKYKSVEMNVKNVSTADCVAIITNHSDYSYQWIVDKSKVVVDTRNATKNIINGKAKIFKL